MGKLRTTISLAAVFVVAFAGTAVANHVYNDVPTNSVFHDEIAEIGDHGCAEGFPGGLFKPDDPVKRQQMARFLSRCGTRVATNSGSVTGVNNMPVSDPSFAEATIEARADGYVVVMATGYATADAANCPCQVLWSLSEDNSTFTNVDTRGFIPGTNPESGGPTTSMAVTHVFPIDQGEVNTYRIRPATTDNQATTHEGRLVAMFVPFDGAPVVN